MLFSSLWMSVPDRLPGIPLSIHVRNDMSQRRGQCDGLQSSSHGEQQLSSHGDTPDTHISNQ